MRVQELNTKWNIRPTPVETDGVQQSFRGRLIVRPEHLIRNSAEDASFRCVNLHVFLLSTCITCMTCSLFRSNKCIHVKLSGDSTVFVERLHYIVFTFTILEENSTGSLDGIHPIALFCDSEKYELVKLALADLIDEMKDTEVITVDDETFRIVYSLGGDYKFPSMVTGIDSANCKYACIWCKCPKESRWITDKTWDSRTTEVNELLSSKSKKSFNVTNPPLFPFIPLQNVVIDNLHLFLRVTNTMWMWK